MAESTFFTRLRRLFSTGVMLKYTSSGLVNVDVKRELDKHKSNFYNSAATNRWNRVHSSGYGYNSNYGFQIQRTTLFNDYEIMEMDPIIASALDIYADECTTPNENGEILSIKCDNDNIREIAYDLFYNIMNINHDLWPGIRTGCKYGDYILYLKIVEGLGVVDVMPLSPYEVVRTEEEQPDGKMKITFRVEGNTIAGEFQEYEIAHFRLKGDQNFLPYGKSLVEGARRAWKQLSLMEDAMMVHRLTRAPEKRAFYVDIGNIDPDAARPFLERIRNQTQKAPLIDPATGDYNLKFNLMNLFEDFWFPIRGSDSNTRIDSLGGLEFNAIEDIEYLRNKMMAALKIPKAFLGYEEQINGKATLAAEDVRFARTIARIQSAFVNELKKILAIHLFSQGFKAEDIDDVEIKLTNPSTIWEQERLSLLQEKVNLAREMKDLSIFDTVYIYDHVFGLADEVVERLRAGVVKDKKRMFRYNQIETEGNDPVETGVAFGVSDVGMGEERPISDRDDIPASRSKAGRPPEGVKYNQGSHPTGRDPLGAEQNTRKEEPTKLRHQYKGNSPLSLMASKFFSNGRLITENFFNEIHDEDQDDLFTDDITDDITE